MKDFHLYIDASYKREGTGRCAGLLVDEHENEYHFSKSVNDAVIKKVYQNKKGVVGSTCYEMFSLYLILRLFHGQNNPNRIENINMVIYTDCESIFKVFYGIEKFKGGYTYRLMKTINRILKAYTRLYNINFEIRWVPGHKNIYYNVIADKLTRIEKDIKLKLCGN